MMEMMMAIKPVRRLKCQEAPWRASCYLLATQPLFESTVRNKCPLVASDSTVVRGTDFLRA